MKTTYFFEKYRLRNKKENYLGHLQKSIVDNVTNIYGILFISTISFASGAFGLYHAWRLSRNSGKSAEKLNPTILPTGIFLLLATLAFSAVIPPYITSHALRFILRPLRHSISRMLSDITLIFDQGLC